MKKLLLTLFVAFLTIAVGWAQSSNFSYGFEAAPGPDDWDDNVMVASGTNGITAATGAFYGQLPGANSDFTRFGGYNSVFPCNGYKTSIKIYLDVAGGWANDTRLDYSVASSGTDGGHVRDFIFSVGFYDDAVAPGTGNRFVASVSNNSLGWPADPSRSPAVIATTSGWYTLEHSFEDNAGVLEVVMKIYDSSDVEVASWTLSDPADLIPSIVGGNRYGWFPANQFSTLAIDDVTLTPNPGNLPTAFTDFETFSTGTVNYQGPGCTTVTPAGYTIPNPYGSLWTTADEWGFQLSPTPFDQEVQDDGGNMVWRVSNAVVSSGFSNQPSSPSSAMVAGESTASLWNDRGPLHTAPAPPNPRASASTPYFHSGFRFKSATGAAQPDLFLSVNAAPRQSNIRMSYVGIEDVGTGFDLNFIETTPGGGFPSTTIASNLSYTDWHELDIYVEFVDGLGAGGTGNDIVTVVLDGTIIHTGTSWETFYAETPGSFPNAPYAVDALMFALRGTAAPGTAGNGFFIDDVVYDNLMAPPPPDRVFVYSDNTLVTLLSSHYNIQDAINAAVAGNAIVADAGIYTENLTISKDLTLLGANAGIDPNTAVRGAETRLLDGSIVLSGTNTIVIDGFEIYQTNDILDVVLIGGPTTATLQNTIINRQGINPGIGTRAVTIAVGTGVGVKTIANNLFTGDTSGGLFSGHKTWNSGMYINGAASTVAINNNVFENCRTALNVDDLSAGITLDGNTIGDSGTLMAFGGTAPTTGSFVFGANDYTPSGGTFMNLSNVDPSFRLDITAGSVDGTAFTAISLADLFLIEATMYHRTRSGRNGLVYYVANTQYVSALVNSDIQTAIDYAAPGDVINIEDRQYDQRLVIDKSLSLVGQSEAGVILDGTSQAGNGRGIFINSGVTDVTIQTLTVQNFLGSNGNTHAGIYANGQNNNLLVENVTIQNNVGGSGFYANGPVDGITLDYVTSSGHTTGARGIVIWNGLKENITITNCEVFNNNCCGIELQDGTSSGVNISNNNVYDNGDNGLGIVGMQGPGVNIVAGNTVTDNGRFGLEIKNPDGSGAASGAGSVLVENNTVSLTAPISDMRDLAGIAVMRRGVLAGNVDLPTGVVVRNNTVSGYQQSSDSDGFGIVIGGTNHTVENNDVSNSDVGIQQQAGHTPYPGDGNQNNIVDDYFGRDNSPATCGNTVTGNTFSGNGVDERNVGAGTGFVTNTDTGEMFCSIQAAISDADTQNGHTITVDAGTYEEDVNINKSVTLLGSGIDITTVIGQIGGDGATFRVAAPGVTIDGFTITREGNNTTDWNNPNLNFAGIAIQGQANDAEIRNNKITGNRTGIDINNSNDNNIHNNVITFNRTGLLFRNQTDNTTLVENEITDSWTMGILFLDASGGTNSPVQSALNSTFNNNNISGNWYGQIVDRQAGGALPAPGTTNLKNFECNWFGSTAPLVSTLDSAEPGYSTAIPVAYGGTAVAPGGQPDILGPGSANFDYIFYLINGTDDEAGTPGFQPVPLSCSGGCPGGVAVLNTDTGEFFCSIQDAIDDVDTQNGHTIEVAAGIYSGNVNINKSLILRGPNTGTSGCDMRLAEAVIQGSFTIGTDGITVDGFEFTGAGAQIASTSGATVRSDIAIINNYIHATTAQIPIRHGLGLGGGIGSANWTVSNNKIEDIQFSNATAIALFNIDVATVQNNCIDHTNTSFTGRRGINTDGLQTANVSGNTIDLGDVFATGTANTPWGIQVSMSDRDATNFTLNGNTISNTFYAIIGLSQRNLTGFNASCNVLTGVARGFTFNSGSATPVVAMPLMSDITIMNNEITSSDRSVYFRNLHNANANGPVNYNNLTVAENKLIRTTAGAALDTDGSTINDGEVKAEFNWYDSAIYSEVLARNLGPIDFIPYQVNDADLDLVTSCFEPDPLVSIGGPVQVYDGNTFIAVYTEIQAAIDDVTTLSGHIVRIASGTYVENVDAVTGGKSLTFAPGASPGCVTIMGDFMLNAGDVLEIEIEGTTACTEHDQFIVTGAIDLGGADIVTPLGMYLALDGDQIVIIDGLSNVTGTFMQGNFVTDGVNNYFIDYMAGVDGFDVVLTKCCAGVLDLGIANYAASTPVGNKLQVFVRPNQDVVNGAYSAGVFTIRTLTSNGVTFTKLGGALSPYDYNQVGTATDGLYTYYLFSYEAVNIVDWTAGMEYLLLTLSYDCIGDAEFELTNDAFTMANNGDYYQELGAAEAQGGFYQPLATSPAAVSITASNNGTVCGTADIDLSSMTTDGTAPYTYAWTGPDGYTSSDEDPAPFSSTLASAGTYTVVVTDANGCTAMATTEVTVLDNTTCVENVTLTTFYPTITQAIDATETLDGHVIRVPAANWPENVNVTKALTINGANVGVPCDDPGRVAESIILGTTAVTINSDGVTLDGFTIEAITGISSTGFEDVSLVNNKINAKQFGITTSVVTTSATEGYTVQDNCIDFCDQVFDTEGFTTSPTLASAQAAGVWYTDRYAPAGFVAEVLGGNSRLKHSIDAADCQSCRPGSFNSTFYNTQGRKYDISGTTAMSIEVYIPASWAATGRRMAGFWGTAVDAGSSTSAFPIIEFTSEDGNPRFRGWDGAGWVDLGLPTGFIYDEWYTLEIALLSSDEFMYSVGDVSASVTAAGSVSIENVILQGHNTDTPGVTYDIYWDNFNSFCAPVAMNAATVGINLTAASGTDAVVLQDNSVSNGFYGYVMAGVTTADRTTVRGGEYTDMMQGVTVVNTLDGVNFVPSTVGVADLSMTSFSGDYPALPATNFHSGVYAFTGGVDVAAIVDVAIDNVTVSNTGKPQQNSAGIHFADFSLGADPRLTATVTNSIISNNLNRGVQIRGGNASAIVSDSDILGNGSDPFGAGGNNGFGVYAGVGSQIELYNNNIVNPASQAGAFPVTAIFNGVAPASTIIANNNNIDDNDNGDVTANTFDISFFDATCNWWGSSNVDDIDALVEGNVFFLPYLDDGTDDQPAMVGFQTSANCINPTDWYVNDNVQIDDVFTQGVGNDSNPGTKRRPFLTIGKAVMTVENNTSTGPDDNSIYVDAGSYDEQVVVPNTVGNLTLQGVGPCDAVAPALTTMVDFTGTVTGKPTIFDIAGDGTVIDGIHFKVDLSILNSAIIASDVGLDNITVQNNCIDPYHSIPMSYFGSYGNRNAISINYGGSTNFRVAAGGVDNILVDNNRVSATVAGTILGDADDIAFRSAVSVDEGAGTYTRNTFQSINHDVLVRFNSNGDVVIGGSPADANTFNGGGVQYADPNAAAGTLTVSHNAFDGSVSGSLLRLQNNYHNASASVSDNTFSNLRWGLSLENFNNVTVADNVFSPLAGFSDFRHVTVNTKSISGNSASIVQVPIDGIFTGNTFNAGTAGTGTAMAFYNHDSDDATLGSFTVGTAGSPNVFAPGFLYAVYLGDQLGSTLAAIGAFPEYNLGAGSDTEMACWDRDIDIQNNTFDVGSGPQLPLVMNNAERLALEDILYHLPDNACLGELIYFVSVLVDAKVYLQGPYDTVSGLMSDNLRAAGLVPTTEPFSSINGAHPGSFVEVNNFVTETIAPSVLAVTGNDAIVDWVWLELRDMADLNTVVATRSALVQRDGDIVDLDGTSSVEFPDTYTGQYYLLVRHRNHLGAMTANPVDFTSFVPIDFTVASEPTFGMTPTSARRLVMTGVYGLWAGNTLPFPVAGFNVRYNGPSNDRLVILNAVGNMTPLNILSNTYQLEDVNMDGQVKYNGARNDRVIILQNVGPATPLNIITQEPNN